jgi:hypothetical protein
MAERERTRGMLGDGARRMLRRRESLAQAAARHVDRRTDALPDGRRLLKMPRRRRRALRPLARR